MGMIVYLLLIKSNIHLNFYSQNNKSIVENNLRQTVSECLKEYILEETDDRLDFHVQFSVLSQLYYYNLRG